MYSSIKKTSCRCYLLFIYPYSTTCCLIQYTQAQAPPTLSHVSHSENIKQPSDPEDDPKHTCDLSNAAPVTPVTLTTGEFINFGRSRFFLWRMIQVFMKFGHQCSQLAGPERLQPQRRNQQRAVSCYHSDGINGKQVNNGELNRTLWNKTAKGFYFVRFER